MPRYHQVISLLSLLLLTAVASTVAGPSARPDEPVRVLSTSEDRVRLLVAPGVPALAGESVRLDGFGELAESDVPALPVRREWIAVPRGATVTARVTGDVAWTTVPLGGPAFDTGDPFPDSPILRITEGVLRGQRYAEIWIVPVRTVPGEAAVEVAGPFEVDILLEGGARRETAAVAVPGVWARALAGQVRNPGAVRVAALERSSLQSSAAGTDGGTEATITGRRWRMAVDQDGVYRLTYEDILANSPDLHAYLTANNANNYQIHNLDTEIPIRVVGAGAGFFGAGDYIEFFGETLDRDIYDDDEFEDGDYHDRNIYWISVGVGPGLRVEERTVPPTFVHPSATTFPETIYWEEDDFFFGVIPATSASHWYDGDILSAIGGPDEATIPIFTPGVAASGTAELRVHMLGLDNPPNLHRTELRVNGALVDGCGDGDGGCVDWDGFRTFTQGVELGTVSFDQSLLSDDADSSITIRAPLDRPEPGITRDEIAVDWIELDYTRDMEADGDRLRFRLDNTGHVAVVSTFTDSAAVAYEVTGKDPVSGTSLGVALLGLQVTGSGPGEWDVRFDVDPDGSLAPGDIRDFIVVSPAGTLYPADVEEDATSNLGDTGNQADIIVIYEGTVLDPLDGGSQYARWKSHRQGPGCWLETTCNILEVEIQDVFDEFSAGIPDPFGIRSFIDHAYHNWTPPAPQVVIIVGDGTHDFKNNYGYGTRRQWIPTFIQDAVPSENITYFSWDNYFATVDGPDVSPDLFLGRLAVHSLDEGEAVFKKLVDHEEASAGQAWQHHTLFVAEREDPEFENVQDRQIENYLLGTPHTYRKVYEQDIVDANPGLTPSEQARLAHDEIDAEIDGTGAPKPGTVMVNYIGHGSVQQWGKNPILFSNVPDPGVDVDPDGTDDVDELSNAGIYPFIMNTNCVTGGFHFSGSPLGPDRLYSLGERLVVAADKGALGILAPSHLTQTFLLSDTNNSVFGTIHGRTKERLLGVVDLNLRTDLLRTNKVIEAKSYAFQGDPLSRLPIPAPAPPTNVVATAGDGVVDLSWTASPDAAEYRLLRALGPESPYSEVSLGTITGSAVQDDTVSNCTDYYYAMVSLDAAGFDGAWSNQNTDCGGADVDCVTARPEPAAPPAAPTSLVATDLESGGRVQLDWLAPVDPGRTGFTVSYGTDPLDLDLTANVSPDLLTTVITGLANDTTYWFEIVARNCKFTSGASDQASAVPTRVLGSKPPATIGDLTVTKSGSDLFLQWSKPLLDVYGKPETVASYDVHHDTATPNYVLGGGSLLSSINDPENTDYLHGGAALGGNPEFYLVVSTDTDGNVSGASHAPPRWVQDLDVTDVGGGQAEICWTAVQEDMTSAPTLVDSYDLYGETSPVRSSMTLLQGGIATTCVTRSIPIDDEYYWNLLVIDNHGTTSTY